MTQLITSRLLLTQLKVMWTNGGKGTERIFIGQSLASLEYGTAADVVNQLFNLSLVQGLKL